MLAFVNPSGGRPWRGRNVEAVLGSMIDHVQMKLNVARLCIDCEEIHEAQQCPVCASETFAYLRRWVPSEARPKKPPTEPAPLRLPSKGKMVGFGIAGLGVWAVARWFSKGREVLERTASNRDTGELK